jgi:hypothetical protein
MIDYEEKLYLALAALRGAGVHHGCPWPPPAP